MEVLLWIILTRSTTILSTVDQTSNKPGKTGLKSDSNFFVSPELIRTCWSRIKLLPEVYLEPLSQNEILLFGGYSSLGRSRTGEYTRGLARLNYLKQDVESSVVNTVNCKDSELEENFVL